MNRKFLTGLIFIAVFAVQSILSAAYVAIVDAGSSGSRMNLFDVVSKDGGVTFTAISLKNSKVVPGISNYATTPDKVSEHIAPLIESLRQGLPSGANESDVSLYFIATAGMRTINPVQQSAVYEKLESYLKTNTTLRIKYLGTCSGKMEGVFDWVALNCLGKKLGTSTTYGVIDMGGASLQVAYEMNVPLAEIIPIKVGEKTYLVYSRSYLGIGADQMRSQYTDNPNCFPKGLGLPDVTGNGDYNKCLENLRAIIVGVHKVDPIPRAILANTEFVGINSLYYVTNSKPFSLGGEVSVSEIKSKGEEFSKMTWEEMLNKWKGDAFLFSYYINSAFIVDFLEVLGFDPNAKIKVVNKIDGVEVSWALGAAVYYANEGNK